MLYVSKANCYEDQVCRLKNFWFWFAVWLYSWVWGVFRKRGKQIIYSICLCKGLAWCILCSGRTIGIGMQDARLSFYILLFYLLLSFYLLFINLIDTTFLNDFVWVRFVVISIDKCLVYMIMSWLLFGIVYFGNIYFQQNIMFMEYNFVDVLILLTNFI